MFVKYLSNENNDRFSKIYHISFGQSSNFSFTIQMHRNISGVEHEIVFTLCTPLTLQTMIETENSLIIHITIMYLDSALDSGSSHGLTFLWSSKVAFD